MNDNKLLTNFKKEDRSEKPYHYVSGQERARAAAHERLERENRLEEYRQPIRNDRHCP